MAIKRIGVLTSGGDAPGMNAAVRAVVRTALYHGIDCYGIRRGWNGLISGDVLHLTEKNISHTINRGGTILYTARSKEFMTEEGQRKAVSTCKFLGLDGIVAIGGDGTFRGARALSKYGINVICIPATIDNDISCTNYSIGFDTAANTAIECIDRLRDTMQSHERCSVVEVMGRNAGFLAMYVGLAVGATAVLVPEEESLMMSAWPQYKDEWNFAQEETQVERMKEIIRGVRNVRAEMNVAPSRKAQTFVVCENEALCKGFEEMKQPHL